MGERGFDAQVLGRLTGWLSAERVHLLQRVMGGVDPGAVLSKHASGLAGLVTELPRVRAALHYHHRQGQPAVRLVNRMCANALRQVRAVRAVWEPDPVLERVARVLEEAHAAVVADQSGFRARAGGFAVELERAADEVPEVLRARFRQAWDGKLGPTAHDVLADEVACLLAAADRDLTALEQDLLTAEVPRDGDAAWELLLPPAGEYRVLGVVRGTSELVDLERFRADAAQWPLREAGGLSWGRETARMRRFAESFTGGGEACLVGVVVTARDKPSAGRLARRTLVELLDQYLAGDRFAAPALEPRVLVTRVAGGTEEIGPSGRGTRRARPLTAPGLPDEVRRALRMAHLAARTDSPSATAALAWSAVEACGLGNRDELAAALALQSLRQAVVHTHRCVRLSVTTRLGYARNRAALAGSAVEQARAALPGRSGRHLEVLERRLYEAEVVRDAAVGERDRLTGVLEGGLARVAEHAPYRYRYHLDDLNRWVGALVDPESPLEELLEHLHPLAVRQARDWRGRLTSPQRCAKWLLRQQHRMTTVLDAVYATRNLTLHAGVFHGAADTVHGVGAVLVTDLVLEMLGNWYNTAGGAAGGGAAGGGAAGAGAAGGGAAGGESPEDGVGGAGVDLGAVVPAGVIAALARRQGRVLAGLSAGQDPSGLDFERLTGPDIAPWEG
ncbi:hypothetical protein KCV87_07925 [Actinosynnema pretiosum subsp. pretiosum]|uniref:Uncharacterized protein n=1 Tax=Actinosynnema pretiosum subsp. pretiosum TaxID=103721 RepID=A0AA45L9V2_9PSEU|nr:hypothetical protein KCV87_07925 [Actinosynnema pretiosum subsp. pretiosum]